MAKQLLFSDAARRKMMDGADLLHMREDDIIGIVLS